MTDYAAVRRAYDTVAEDYAERLPDTRAEAVLDLAMVDAFVAAVRADVPDPATAPVLDAGCGAGRMSGYVAARGAAVCGVDSAPEGTCSSASSRAPASGTPDPPTADWVTTSASTATPTQPTTSPTRVPRLRPGRW
ncbi:MAG TPA: methyltransferase domain-containing protein [Humibacillus xanthopallidus]|nr:methyltransferase domain-containing protein [Humibacillus xanthopallidus]